MTEEAREAAKAAYIAHYRERDSMLDRAKGFDAGYRQGDEAGYRAGVTEGIRQAREAVETTGPTWHRGMYGAPDDMYAHIAIVRAFESLAAIDALGGE